MSWEENPVDTQVVPRRCQIWEWYAPVGVFLDCVCFIIKVIGSIFRLSEVTFMVLSLMFVSNFGVET
jgi:hypothetical protein